MAKQDKQDKQEPAPPITIETVQEGVAADKVEIVKGAAVVSDADPKYEIFYAFNNAGEIREIKTRRGEPMQPLVLGERMATDEEIAEYKKAHGRG